MAMAFSYRVVLYSGRRVYSFRIFQKFDQTQTFNLPITLYRHAFPLIHPSAKAYDQVSHCIKRILSEHFSPRGVCPYFRLLPP
jgi:hypothetical protein